jgi:hypothetical protein
MGFIALTPFLVSTSPVIRTAIGMEGWLNGKVTDGVKVGSLFDRVCETY